MGNRRQTVILLLVWFGLLGCTFTRVEPDPVVPKPDPVIGADCQRVCDTQRKLGCEFGNGDGESSCEEICVNAAEYLDLACLAGMTSCDQDESCSIDES